MRRLGVLVAGVQVVRERRQVVRTRSSEARGVGWLGSGRASACQWSQTRAVVPPIVVRDELASGALVEATDLADITETFFAVTPRRRFPNAVLRDVLAAVEGA